MSTEFQPNTVAYGDAAGLGAWADGHYRQHLKYNAILAAQTNPIVLPEFPIFYFPLFGGPEGFSKDEKEIKFWLNSHESWHELLRPIANITSANLADLDYTDPNYFYEWQDTHNTEHTLLDLAFGAG